MCPSPEADRRPRVELSDPLVVDGAPVPARLAQLLRRLLEADGRVVNAAMLQDELWPAMEVSDPAAALHTLISRARRLGIPIERFGSGYRVMREHVDLVCPAHDAPPPAAPPPAARAVSALPPGWRAARRPLMGRDADVTGVAEALRSSRLVTLVGPGGAGKTSVAAEVARRRAAPAPHHTTETTHRDEIGPAGDDDESRPAGDEAGRAHPDETVGVAELAAITGADDVADAVLTAAGAPQHTPASRYARPRALTRAERLAALDAPALGGEHILVVDNCEHVLDAVSAVVAELIDTAPHLRVLATSRSPLGLRGERVMALESLPQQVACELLATLVRDAGGDRISPDDADVRELVRRLDALPLALELVAARSRSLSPAQLLATLGSDASHLTRVVRDVPARHTSLWTLIEWSWRLLDAPHQDLLAALSVTRGTVDLSLAASLAGASLDATREMVAALVDSSLLHRADDGWRLLETVREFAQGRLRSAGPRRETEVLDRLASWARQLAHEAIPRLFGPTQVPTLRLLEHHRETLLRAAEHSETTRWSVCSSLALAGMMAGGFTDIAMIEQLVETPPPADVPHEDVMVIAGMATLTLAISGRLRAAARAWRLARGALERRSAARESESRRASDPAALPTLGGVVHEHHVTNAIEGSPDDGLDRISELTLLSRALLAPRDDRPPPGLEPFLRSADPLVRGLARTMSVSLDTSLWQTSASARQAIADQLRRAYDECAQARDEWAMASCASVMAQHLTEAEADPAETGRWWARGEQHLRAVGSAPDLTINRVMRDISLAVGGDEEAAARLTEHAELPEGDIGRPYVCFGLGLRACLHTGDWVTGAEHLRTAHAEALVVEGVTPLTDAVLAAAAGAAGTRAGAPWAPEYLDRARTLLTTVTDHYVVGTVGLAWALWSRQTSGDDASDDELAALGHRLGGNLSIMLSAERTRGSLHVPASPLAQARAHELSTRQAAQRVRQILDEIHRRTGGAGWPSARGDASTERATAGPRHRRGPAAVDPGA